MGKEERVEELRLLGLDRRVADLEDFAEVESQRDAAADNGTIVIVEPEI